MTCMVAGSTYRYSPNTRTEVILLRIPSLSGNAIIGKADWNTSRHARPHYTFAPAPQFNESVATEVSRRQYHLCYQLSEDPQELSRSWSVSIFEYAFQIWTESNGGFSTLLENQWKMESRPEVKNSFWDIYPVELGKVKAMPTAISLCYRFGIDIG